MQRSLVLLALSLCACRGAGDLTVRLLVAAGVEDPFAGLERLTVEVLDASFGRVTTLTGDAQASSLDLGALGPGAGRRLRIEGLRAGASVARGETRVLEIKSGQVREELVPFSSEKVAVALAATRAFAAPLAIDGLPGEWLVSPSIVLDERHRVAGPSTTARDLRAEVLLSWSADLLHFAIRVIDDCAALVPDQVAGRCPGTSRVDHVLLGLDAQKNGGDFGAGDLWLKLTATGVTVEQGQLTPAELTVRFSHQVDGWSVEGSLATRVLGRALAARDQLGFDVLVVDEDAGDSEPTVLRWTGGTGPAAPTRPAQMGTIGLID